MGCFMKAVRSQCTTRSSHGVDDPFFFFVKEKTVQIGRRSWRSCVGGHESTGPHRLHKLRWMQTGLPDLWTSELAVFFGISRSLKRWRLYDTTGTLRFSETAFFTIRVGSFRRKRTLQDEIFVRRLVTVELAAEAWASGAKGIEADVNLVWNTASGLQSATISMIMTCTWTSTHLETPSYLH